MACSMDSVPREVRLGPLKFEDFRRHPETRVLSVLSLDNCGAPMFERALPSGDRSTSQAAGKATDGQGGGGVSKVVSPLNKTTCSIRALDIENIGHGSKHLTSFDGIAPVVTTAHI